MVTRVGRGGFTGSSITEWCAACGDYAVPGRAGRCMWCDAAITAPVLRAEMQRRADLAVIAAARELGINNRIVRMRAQGKSWRAIGVAVGFEEGTCRYRHQRLIREAGVTA